MATHLRKCVPAQLGGETAGADDQFLLRVQARGTSIYWLDILVKPEAKLKALDKSLRDIWVECCGHLSGFYDTSRRELRMSRAIGEALITTSGRLRYEYDFGSTTELVVNHSGVAHARLSRPVHLLARNEPPVWPCHVCGQPAAAICMECQYDDKGLFCREHAEEHECGEDMLLPVVNSPRMGVCGYVGGV